VIETRSAALSRNRIPLATLAEHGAFRGDAASAFASLPEPPEQACVVTGLLPGPVGGALSRSAWHGVRRHQLPDVIGHHEAIGAAALAVAVAEVATGAAAEALVVTAEQDTVYVSRIQRYEAEA
jgi:hypothetical protein